MAENQYYFQAELAYFGVASSGTNSEKNFVIRSLLNTVNTHTG
jgi:hypothetical protein